MRTEPALEYVTVYCGSHARVTVLEGLLAAEGIPCFVPDRLVKTVDPFITGASALELRLQVPAPFEAAARDVVVQGFPLPEPAAAPRQHRLWRWLALLLLGSIAVGYGFQLIQELVN